MPLKLLTAVFLTVRGTVYSLRILADLKLGTVTCFVSYYKPFHTFNKTSGICADKCVSILKHSMRIFIFICLIQFKKVLINV